MDRARSKEPAAPENNVIAALAERALARFSLDTALLQNWQIEFCSNDVDHESLRAAIQHDVIMLLPMGKQYFGSDLRDHLMGAIAQTDELNTDIYMDFKLVIYELLQQTLFASMRAKIELHALGIQAALIEDLQLYLGRDDKSDKIVELKVGLIVSSFELGCSNETLRAIIRPLFTKLATYASRYLHLSLLLQIVTRYPTHFTFSLIEGVSSQVSRLPLFRDFGSSKGLTLQTWFKFATPSSADRDNFDIVPLFLLGHESAREDVLRIQLVNRNQIMVELFNATTGSRMQFTFNHIVEPSPTNQHYTHLVVTYDSFQNINLYVDGEYSESIPCSSLAKCWSSWNTLFIGSTNVGIGRDELLIKDLTVFDRAIPYEWVALMYALGIGFDWSNKDFSEDTTNNLLNHLGSKELVKLGVNFSRILGPSTPVAKSRKTTKQQRLEVTDKCTMLRALTRFKLKTANVLFDSNDREFINHTDVTTHESKSVNGALYCLGGASLLLTMIELIAKDSRVSKTESNQLFLTSMELLLTCVTNSWRINKEFENQDGYNILLLILGHFKTQHNQSLQFDSSLTRFTDYSNDDGILGIFLRFTCTEVANVTLLHNFNAYKYLVLNFDLYSGTLDYAKLHTNIQSLIGPASGSLDNYQISNVRELAKMKLLRKSLQFMKLQILHDARVVTDPKDLLNTLNTMIRAEISVDSIKSLSRFVTFALHNKVHNEEGRAMGLAALQSLIDGMTSLPSSSRLLKKLSRSITVHWILLLLSFDAASQKESRRVNRCGVVLLTRLLKALGPSIVKRFFHSNRGLDVLTRFLQDSWDDAEVMSLVFLASFGLESSQIKDYEPSLGKLALCAAVGKAKVVVPEFLLLLNNLALMALYTLGKKLGKVLSVPNSPKKADADPDSKIIDLSLNTLHLMNLYADMISAGMEKSPSLHAFFGSKEWLEGIFELLGQLKLSLTWKNKLFKSFRSCVDRLVTALSNIFVSRLLDVQQLFVMFRSLSDITMKLIFDCIFPKIFSHINQFVTESNFIFNAKEFLDGTSDLLTFYYSEFISENFEVSAENMDTYLTCCVSVYEACEATASSHVHSLAQLKALFGHSLVLKLSNFKHSSDENTDQEYLKDQLDEAVKFMMCKLVVFLDTEVLTDTYLAQVIELLMGIFLQMDTERQLAVAEHHLNFLRTCYILRKETFGLVVKQVTSVSDYRNSADIIENFFADLVTKNDDETVRFLLRFPSIKHIFIKNFHFRLDKIRNVGAIKVVEMLSVTLNDGGKLSVLDSPYIRKFEQDCETLKVQSINNELTRYNREIQDRQDNYQFFAVALNSLKTEVYRLFGVYQTKSTDYMLDYIEGVDRMRKLLVVEDQLPDSERLSYSLDIPMRPVEVNMDNVSDLASFTESLLLGEAEDLEEIEDDGEKKKMDEDRNRKVIRSLYLGDQINMIWNVSRINGLQAIESLMIMGASHIYLIENYFHCPDGNVVEAQDAPKELRDPYIELVNSGLENGNTHRTKSWSFENFSCVSKRKFLLRDIALEMFFTDGASILLTCLSTQQRDAIFSKLTPYATRRGLDKDLAITLELSSNALQLVQYLQQGTFASKLAAAFSTSFANTPNFFLATKKWRSGELSNFYYLMTINTMAGRTFNDLTQYPVFPWVIADYESEELDFDDPRTFRDLSKPMGAQTADRAAQFKERYDAMTSLNDENAPPFHYGTHYSSAMIVCSYLIRLKPYVQSYLLLQGGKFDHAERLFSSVGKAWYSASRDNTTDVRELIPEFFFLPEFLVNSNNFDFGKSQSGDTIDDVELPKWAKGDPKIFIAKNREALESPYVSQNLHKWIDLVFGYKQSGPEAVAAINVFHHSSYDGAINLDSMKDETEKRAVIGMINNFGQTPMKLFLKPHPPREVLNLPNLYLTMLGTNQKPALTFESKLQMPIVKLEFSQKSKKWIGRPQCVVSEDDLLIRKPTSEQFAVKCGSLIINTLLFINLHLSNITAVAQIGDKYFLTGAENGVVIVWRFASVPFPSVTFQRILRGHVASIKTLKFSKTFKVCLSLDDNGELIVWDCTRFSFIRQLTLASGDHLRHLVAISNDTGTFCTLHNTKYGNTLSAYTLNGELMVQQALSPGSVTAVGFANLNDSQLAVVRDEFRHTYWTYDIVVVAYAHPKQCLEIYELLIKNLWRLQLMQTVKLDFAETVTALEVMRHTEVDPKEKLSRGFLSVAMGTNAGRVYVL